MSSESSLVTTAASDTSSSADSRIYPGGPRREAMSMSVPSPWYSSPRVQSSPAAQSPRQRSGYNLKARGVVIAKGGVNQKVLCACKSCKGQRMVSKSTCYRHLRVEREIEEDDVHWDYARWIAHKNLAPSNLGNHLPSIPTGFHSSQLVQ